MNKNNQNINQTTEYNSNQLEDEIDLLEIFGVIFKYRKFIVKFSTVFCLFAFIILFFINDTYQAKATIMPVQGRKSTNIPFFQQTKEFEEIKNILSANMPAVFSDSNTTNLRAVLLSRSFNIHLVEKYNLLPKLFPDYWNKNENKWIGTAQRKLYHEPTVLGKLFGYYDNFNKYAPTSIDGAYLLMKKLKFEKNNPNGDWLVLSFEDKDPAFAAAILNNYITELDYYLRNKEIERMAANQKYLQELISTQKNEDIRQGLNRVIISQMETAMYAKVTADFAFKTIDPALIPQKPYKPKRLVILILTCITSCFCALFVVFIKEYLGTIKNRWIEIKQKNSRSGISGMEVPS